MTLHAATYSGLVCTENRPLKIDELLGACEADARILSQPVVDGMTPLNIACARRDQDAVRRLLALGASPLLLDLAGNAPLHVVAALPERHARAALRLLDALSESGAEIDATDGSGRTPLMVACGSEAVSLARVLVDRGADISRSDTFGATAWDHLKAAHPKISINKTAVRLAEVLARRQRVKNHAIPLALSTATDPFSQYAYVLQRMPVAMPFRVRPGWDVFLVWWVAICVLTFLAFVDLCGGYGFCIQVNIAHLFFGWLAILLGLGIWYLCRQVPSFSAVVREFRGKVRTSPESSPGVGVRELSGLSRFLVQTSNRVVRKSIEADISKFQGVLRTRRRKSISALMPLAYVAELCTTVQYVMRVFIAIRKEANSGGHSVFGSLTFLAAAGIGIEVGTATNFLLGIVAFGVTALAMVMGLEFLTDGWIYSVKVLGRRYNASAHAELANLATGVLDILRGQNERMQRRIKSALTVGEELPVDGPFGLFLRSFGLDCERVAAGEKFEDLLCYLLRQNMPLLAIGQDAQGAGAIRVAETDDSWQSRVLDLAGRAEAIYMLPAPTKGVRWELEQIAAHGWLPKTIFFMPPSWMGGARRNRAAWTALLRLDVCRHWEVPGYCERGAVFQLDNEGRLLDWSHLGVEVPRHIEAGFESLQLDLPDLVETDDQIARYDGDDDGQQDDGSDIGAGGESDGGGASAASPPPAYNASFANVMASNATLMTMLGSALPAAMLLEDMATQIVDSGFGDIGVQMLADSAEGSDGFGDGGGYDGGGYDGGGG